MFLYNTITVTAAQTKSGPPTFRRYLDIAYIDCIEVGCFAYNEISNQLKSYAVSCKYSTREK